MRAGDMEGGKKDENYRRREERGSGAKINDRSDEARWQVRS